MFAFRRTRKFVRTVLLLALGLYLLAHLLIRSEWVGGRVLRTISERTGYEAAASRVRLTAALALSFTDFSLSYRDGGATNVVFSAPHLRFGWCCGRSAEAVRAQVFVRRTAGGTTVPSQFRPPAGAAVAPDDLPRAVSPNFGSLHFRLTDSTLTVLGEGEDVVYDGLDWLREPVDLEGHSGAVQNVLTVQAVRPVQAEGGTFAPHELRDEWFELEGRSVRFDTRSDTGAETADESHAESAECAETAGGANSPSEPPTAVESHAENAESAEPVGGRSVEEKIGRLVLKKVDFDQATLPEILKVLETETCRADDPGLPESERGIRFAIADADDGLGLSEQETAPRMTIHSTDLPIRDLLDILTNLTRTKWSIVGDSVTFRPALLSAGSPLSPLPRPPPRGGRRKAPGGVLRAPTRLRRTRPSPPRAFRSSIRRIFPAATWTIL